MKPIVNLYKLGRLPYVEGLNIQQALFNCLLNNLTVSSHIVGNTSKANNFDAIIGYSKKQHFSIDINNLTANNTFTTNNNINNNTFNPNHQARNSLLLVEHEPVYTIGIRSKDYNEGYIGKLKQELREHNLDADFVKTNRGGLITFHGPGQLVAYPIIYLGDFKNTIQNRSVRAYVNTLESVIIDTLSNVGLHHAHTVKEYPGVWVDSGKRKIAFIGISCKRFVTMHGISINCDCDLSWFDHIVSCGIEDKEITSISKECLSLSKDKYYANTNHHDYSTNSLLSKTMKGVSSSQLNDKNELLHQFSLANKKKNIMNHSRSEFSIEAVSNSFCLSFSKHFDCIIKENDRKSLFPILGKL